MIPSVNQGKMPKVGNKAAPRSGAAKGQGNGMGGYNGAAVGRAMAMVKGGGGKPSYGISGKQGR